MQVTDLRYAHNYQAVVFYEVETSCGTGDKETIWVRDDITTSEA